jgi:glycosyltransferase involved in cell wall biosynthesis
MIRLLLVLFAFCLSAKDNSICLNMIVKDESSCIERCLASVKPYIDYWVIVDTGSSDGTQKIIADFMKDIPGELHEKPWVNFEHNRNEALDLARGKSEYILTLDADEQLVPDAGFVMPKLDKGAYFATVRQNELVDFLRILIIRDVPSWHWEGVLHETLATAERQTSDVLTGIYNVTNNTDGNRSKDPQKFVKDAQVLEKALEKDPNNSRYVFYLAQSYADAGDFRQALKNYERRSKMGGWDQEVFWALYSMGQLQEKLGMGEAAFIKSYSDAYKYRQSRAEPLYRLIHYYIRSENYVLAYALVKEALRVPFSKDNVYVERWMYEYGLIVALSDCAFQLGRMEEALHACQEALTKPTMPQILRTQLTTNVRVIHEILAKANEQQSLAGTGS